MLFFKLISTGVVVGSGSVARLESLKKLFPLQLMLVAVIANFESSTSACAYPLSQAVRHYRIDLLMTRNQVRIMF